MKSVALSVQPRSVAKRAQVKKLRDQGKVPAVIYGRLAPPQNLELALKDLELLIHHSVTENVLVDLTVAGDARPKRLALMQEVQHHALTGKVLHVDFHEVSEDEKVTVMVPVEKIGEAEGVKTGGGVLEHVLFKLKVRALPKDLPELITVDVSPLQIGQAIHIGELPPIAGVEFLGDKSIPVFSVAAPVSEAQEVAAAEAAAAGPAQPEMIKEKKEEAAAGAEGGDKKDKAEKAEKKK